MAHLSKDALDDFLAVVKAADKTFLDPDKNLDEQGKVDGYSHLFHLLRTTIDFYLFNDPLQLREPHLLCCCQQTITRFWGIMLTRCIILRSFVAIRNI